MNTRRVSVYDSPLFSGIRMKSLDYVQNAIAMGANVNMLAVRGGSYTNMITPLYYACEMGDINIVKALLAAGANPDMVSTYRKVTALAFASEKGDLNIVNALIGAGADVNKKSGDPWISALGYAVGGNHTEVVQALVAAGAKADSSEELQTACRKGNVEIVKALITAGADINVEIFYNVPLMYAAAHTPVMAVLIEAGANVNPRGYPSPLWATILKGNADGLRLLIKAGADFERIREEMTPLEYVCANNQVELARVLLDAYLENNKPLLPQVFDKAMKGSYTPEIKAVIMEFEHQVLKKRRGPLVDAWVRRRHTPGNNTRKAKLEEQVDSLLRYRTLNNYFRNVSSSTRRRKRSSRKRR